MVAIFAFAAAVLGSSCVATGFDSEPAEAGGLSRLAKADSAGFVLSTESRKIDFLTGVNVGPTVPGRLPSELAIDAETWRRWLPMIANTGFHAIRVYTLQPPHFYRELRDYNLTNADHPIYLVQGVWVVEEPLSWSQDVFDPAVLNQTRTDIATSVAALHGDIVLSERRGYASGVFDADVSPWTVSWAFGIEMDPSIIQHSNEINGGRTYSGEFIGASTGASPTEAWLAEMLDRLATEEASYGLTMPLTFTNWPTTDPIDHPYEPSENEDLVGLDANHLIATDDWPGGLYASYHAYPYYPDFQRYEPGIADYIHEGTVDAYAGYLTALRTHHAKAGLPVMILEFGVPSSLGSSHRGPGDRDQGGHSEPEALAINGELLRIQRTTGMSGGFVFAWHDEWFKRSWNTMETEQPADRRQLWQNVLTSEAHFGLLAIEAGSDGPPVQVDGFGEDWRRDNSQVIFESGESVREIRVTHDEAYLYLRLIVDEDRIWVRTPLTIGFDVVPGGGGEFPGEIGIGKNADTAIVIGPGMQAKALVRASNDYNDLVLGRRFGHYAVSEDALVEGSGVWNPQRMMINRPHMVPAMELEEPVEFFELNPLVQGSSSPSSDEYDSRTTWAADARTIELRVPWAMVGLSDPSSRSALTVAADGTISTIGMERLGIVVMLGGQGYETSGYSWEKWNRVTWRERPKAGLDGFRTAVLEVADP